MKNLLYGAVNENFFSRMCEQVKQKCKVTNKTGIKKSVKEQTFFFS